MSDVRILREDASQFGSAGESFPCRGVSAGAAPLEVLFFKRPCENIRGSTKNHPCADRCRTSNPRRGVRGERGLAPGYCAGSMIEAPKLALTSAKPTLIRPPIRYQGADVRTLREDVSQIGGAGESFPCRGVSAGAAPLKVLILFFKRPCEDSTQTTKIHPCTVRRGIANPRRGMIPLHPAIKAREFSDDRHAPHEVELF
jgi:hypothetical protein